MIPTVRGGKNTYDNLCVLDADVNRAKGTQTTEEFVAMCREVVSWMDGTRQT